MLRFDNSHIFTGYLKQKLSSINIPICKIYTREHENYFINHGVEDPRIVESTDTLVYTNTDKQLATRINYLRGNEVFNYYNENSCKLNGNTKTGWTRANLLFYDSSKNTPGLTKTLNSPGTRYDRITHEYLGDYLRFMRDYHGINLMSMYNCFNNTLCNNVHVKFTHNNKEVEFSSYDSKYKIYAFPVKLFSKYTIAIDSHHGIEIFCGLYNSRLYSPDANNKLLKNDVPKNKQLGSMTYLKTGKLSFKEPIIFDKLCVDNWLYNREVTDVSEKERILNTKTITRWDILNREQDLKMFIKVPVSCRSSIVVLEGDYRSYNNARYVLNPETNIDMTGCSLNNFFNLDVPEDTAATVKGYKISAWQFDCRNTTADYKVGDEKFGLIIPSLNRTDMPEGAEIWDGSSCTKPEYSADLGCCIIKTGADLAFVIANNGKVQVTVDGINKTINYFKLVNDIYLNNPTKIDWQTGNILDPNYTANQWFYSTEKDRLAVDAPSFSGTIDGDGHIIFGLYIKNNDDSITHGGLVPLIDGDGKTTLKNLGLGCAYIRCTHSLGFIGNTTSSTSIHNTWKYEQNHSVINMDHRVQDDIAGFKPISKLQLLEFNTGESFPFADRLLEYLCESAITPLDEIPDNIKRAQHVMEHNGYNFKIKGLWENKMQKILYDYTMSSGPLEIVNNKKVDRRLGYHPSLGHRSKSTLYDVLGYIDKDAEKWYAGTTEKNKVIVRETIQHADIYNGLYDL